jgi:hypothetical protein
MTKRVSCLNWCAEKAARFNVAAVRPFPAVTLHLPDSHVALMLTNVFAAPLTAREMGVLIK